MRVPRLDGGKVGDAWSDGSVHDDGALWAADDALRPSVRAASQRGPGDRECTTAGAISRVRARDRIAGHKRGGRARGRGRRDEGYGVGVGAGAGASETAPYIANACPAYFAQPLMPAGNGPYACGAQPT